MTRQAARSARRELRALVARALAREPGIPEAAARRVTDRILREVERIAEITAPLAADGPPPRAAEPPRPVLVRMEPREEPFDPYAVGAVVTLQRFGAGALMERLSEIGRVEDLLSLAAAQNLALSASWTNAEELRAAIVQGAEQRLAERRAAAS